jgi:hypothetical protein
MSLAIILLASGRHQTEGLVDDVKVITGKKAQFKRRPFELALKSTQREDMR